MVSKKKLKELVDRLRGNTGISEVALLAALAAKGMTASALSEASGVGRSSIWRLCNEPRKPRVATVLALAKALGVCPLTLVPRARVRPRPS